MSNNTPLNNTAEWDDLKAHQESLRGVHMRDLFAQDPQRFEKFHIEIDGCLFDFSKHGVTSETLEKLAALAKVRDVEGWRKKMQNAYPINSTENQASLHMALRGSLPADLEVNGENVQGFVNDTLAQIKEISEAIRSNDNITDVVNIGIGGSDLGPRMMCRALSIYADGPKTHFVSNIDGAALTTLLKNLRPESTLFIVSSKTFSTQETITNAQSAKAWLLGAIDEEALLNHFVAVTNNVEAAVEFGVDSERILPMRDWIGGRFSLWGSIGVSLAISNGFEAFKEILKGAADADGHFLSAPITKNIPVMMAMLGVWHRNFEKRPAHAVIPYAANMQFFPRYLQQVDMESNGKSVDRSGSPINYETGPVIFGDVGTNAQHAFMQLMHQGPDVTPVDFILYAQPQAELGEHNRILLGNALAQSEALLEGRNNPDAPHKNCPGNRPSSLLIFDKLDAYHLGMLCALYEHKIFVQGVIWGVNSFDQWGVELGKNIATDIIANLKNNSKNKDITSTTSGALSYISKKFIKS